MKKSRDPIFMEMRRRQGVAMYKKGFNQNEVAEALDVTQASVSRWLSWEEQGGEDALKSKPLPGAVPKLNDKEKDELKILLLRNPKEFGFEAELWTSPMVKCLIRKQFGVIYHEGHVRKLLHELGMSPQKPVKRASQRDEDAIEKWRKEEWPKIKKNAGTRCYTGVRG
jgi:transposase